MARAFRIRRAVWDWEWPSHRRYVTSAIAAAAEIASRRPERRRTAAASVAIASTVPRPMSRSEERSTVRTLTGPTGPGYEWHRCVRLGGNSQRTEKRNRDGHLARARDRHHRQGVQGAHAKLAVPSTETSQLARRPTGGRRARLTARTARRTSLHQLAGRVYVHSECPWREGSPVPSPLSDTATSGNTVFPRNEKRPHRDQETSVPLPRAGLPGGT